MNEMHPCLILLNGHSIGMGAVEFRALVHYEMCGGQLCLRGLNDPDQSVAQPDHQRVHQHDQLATLPQPAPVYAVKTRPQRQPHLLPAVDGNQFAAPKLSSSDEEDESVDGAGPTTPPTKPPELASLSAAAKRRPFQFGFIPKSERFAQEAAKDGSADGPGEPSCIVGRSDGTKAIPVVKVKRLRSPEIRSIRETLKNKLKRPRGRPRKNSEDETWNPRTPKRMARPHIKKVRLPSGGGSQSATAQKWSRPRRPAHQEKVHTRQVSPSSPPVTQPVFPPATPDTQPATSLIQSETPPRILVSATKPEVKASSPVTLSVTSVNPVISSPAPATTRVVTEQPVTSQCRHLKQASSFEMTISPARPFNLQAGQANKDTRTVGPINPQTMRPSRPAGPPRAARLIRLTRQSRPAQPPFVGRAPRPGGAVGVRPPFVGRFPRPRGGAVNVRAPFVGRPMGQGSPAVNARPPPSPPIDSQPGRPGSPALHSLPVVIQQPKRRQLHKPRARSKSVG